MQHQSYRGSFSHDALSFHVLELQRHFPNFTLGSLVLILLGPLSLKLHQIDQLSCAGVLQFLGPGDGPHKAKVSIRSVRRIPLGLDVDLGSERSSFGSARRSAL